MTGKLELPLTKLCDITEYFKDIERELSAYSRSLGYDIDVRKCAVGKSRDVVTEMRKEARALADRNVEGVIFRPLINEKYTEVNQEVARLFEEVEKPVVLFDSDIDKKPRRSAYDIVTVNNVDAGRSVADYLIASGRKRIAFNMVDCVGVARWIYAVTAAKSSRREECDLFQIPDAPIVEFVQST